MAAQRHFVYESTKNQVLDFFPSFLLKLILVENCFLKTEILWFRMVFAAAPKKRTDPK
jgi:hypothetical protein